MGATQVVLYFDRQEDALLFTLAASSAIAADEPVHANEAMKRLRRNLQGQPHYHEGVLDPQARRMPVPRRSNALRASHLRGQIIEGARSFHLLHFGTSNR